MKKTLLDLQHDQYGVKAIFHAVMGIVILFLGNILASLPVDLFYFITKMEVSPLILIIRPVLEIAVLLLLVCLYISKVLKLPLRDFRICKPKSILIWLACSAVLPLAVSGFFILLTPGIFSASGLDIAKITRIILRAVFSSCLVAGITEELVFRGLIMHVLELKWGKPVAIVAPSVLFGLLHIFSMKAPTGVDVLLLLITGTGVGIMFSLIAIQSGSIWSSAIVHGIWNLIIIGGILEISIEPSSSIFTYKLISDSKLLTGGAFGIESSLPAIIGYGIVILIAVLLRGRTFNIRGGAAS